MIAGNEPPTGDDKPPMSMGEAICVGALMLLSAIAIVAGIAWAWQRLI